MRPLSHKLAGRIWPAVFKSSLLLGAVATICCIMVPQSYAVLARPRGARRSAEDAARRMLALSSAYLGPSMLETRPTFVVQDLTVPSARTNYVWLGCIRGVGQELQFVMNDRTGNLLFAFGAGRSAQADCAGRSEVSVDNVVHAAKLSIFLARRLQMVPEGSKIALVGVPTLGGAERVWRSTWRIRRRPTSAPYNLKVGLYQQGGLLKYAESEDRPEH